MPESREQAPVANFEFETGGELREKCGVVGVYQPDGTAPQSAFYAIDALQHRGQDGVGLSVEVETDGRASIQIRKALSKVAMAWDRQGFFKDIDTKSDYATAHVTYKTTEREDDYEALQPLEKEVNGDEYSISHNGQFDIETLSEVAYESGLEPEGSDSEVFAKVLQKKIKDYGHIEPALHQLLPQLEGAFSLIIQGPEGIYAVRDRHGIRPLAIGHDGEATMAASEVRALEGKDKYDKPRLDFEFEREVDPGTYVVINEHGVRDVRWAKEDKKTCLFEKVYLSKPDNIIDGQLVSDFRYKVGEMLAEMETVDADIVIPVLGSAKFYAHGYADKSGLEYNDEILEKNEEIGRTFLQKTLADQQDAVENKFKINPEYIEEGLLEGKKVIVVDDSVVRGNTIRKIVRLFKDAGAAEVYVRSGSDLYSKTCAYGVNVQSEEELLSYKRKLEEMREEIGADSLAFIPLEKMHEAAEVKADEVCDGCMGGSYPEKRKESERVSILALAGV